MPLDQSIPYVASPNFSSRRGVEVEATVIHYTAAGRASGSIAWLCDSAARASAHFVVSRSGRTTQLVELGMRAWHAGTAEMVLASGECVGRVNHRTIGVELANCGRLHEEEDGEFYFAAGRSLVRYRGPRPVRADLEYDGGLVVGGWWEPYPDIQLDALQELLRLIAAKGYNRAAGNLLGHEEVGMPQGRKMDPGGVFPWDRFLHRAPRRTRSTIHGANDVPA